MLLHKPDSPTNAILGPGKVPITLHINGQAHTLYAEPRRTLLDALRYDLSFTGTKFGCGEGTCGTCTVIVDGQALYSCLLLAVGCQGRQIRTIEGLARDGDLHPLQAAFVAHDATQCGFCTPGQLMSLVALLESDPHPDEAAVRRAISGNLCRCGTYPKIFRAVASLVGGEGQ